MCRCRHSYNTTKVKTKDDKNCVTRDFVTFETSMRTIMVLFPFSMLLLMSNYFGNFCYVMTCLPFKANASLGERDLSLSIAVLKLTLLKNMKMVCEEEFSGPKRKQITPIFITFFARHIYIFIKL